MPIIYTYPSATPTTDDLILISDVSATNPTKATRKCTIGDIVTLVGALVPGGGTVTSVGLSGGTTGLTIATTTTNPIVTTGTFTVGGTLVAANGGTGHASYAVGDILYASGATTLTKLSSGVLNTVLTSGGLLTAPSWIASTVAPVTSVTAIAPATQSGTNPIVVTPTTGLVTVQSLTYDGGLKAGHVPGTSGGDATKYLNGAAGFTVPPDTNTTYSLMTSSVLGLGKLENNTTQTIVANAPSVTANRTYGVQKNTSDQLVVNVPWSGGGAKVAYDTTLEFRGGGSGTFTGPWVVNKAQYWHNGDYIYMEFYLEWLRITSFTCVGSMIMTQLPLSGASPVGVALEQGSCLITRNTYLGRSTTLTAPKVGRVGVTGANEILLKTTNDAIFGVYRDSDWGDRATGESDSFILAGTATWLMAT